MTKRRRAVALLLCAGLIALMVLSSAFILHELGHDCAGEDCPVCAMLAQLHRLRRGLGAALNLLPFAALGTALCLAAAAASPIARPAVTGVTLRVRMND